MPRETLRIAEDKTRAQFAKIRSFDLRPTQRALCLHPRQAMIDEDESRPRPRLGCTTRQVDGAHVTLHQTRWGGMPISATDPLCPVRCSSLGTEGETIIVVHAIRLIGVPPHGMTGGIRTAEHHVIWKLVMRAFGVELDAAVFVQRVLAVKGVTICEVAAPTAILVALCRVPLLDRVKRACAESVISPRQQLTQRTRSNIATSVPERRARPMNLSAHDANWTVLPKQLAKTTNQDNLLANT